MDIEMNDKLGAAETGLSAAKQALLRARMKQNVAREDRIPLSKQTEGPVSFAQQRLWFLDQFYPRSCAYNVPRVLRITGSLDLHALQLALNAIVKRHEILRTNFKPVKEEPFQVVSEASEVPLHIVDLTTDPPEERETKAKSVVENEIAQPFDLSSDLMLRATLLRLKKDEHILILMSHHIASDGWSKGLMFNELATLYNSGLTKTPAALAELPIQYSDFSAWQRARVKGEVLQSQLAYWKRQLAGVPASLDLPTDYPRPPVQGFAGTTQSDSLPAELVAALKTLSKSEGVTLFMTLLASFQLLLSRYAGQEDVVVGTPIAGRTRPEVEPLIGDFVNMLAMRTNFSGDPTFRELLKRVREVVFQAYENQDLPFERVVEELEHGRDMSRAPIFQTIFILETAPPPPPRLEGLSVQILDFDTPTAKNDLILILADDKNGFKVKLEYSTDLFSKQTIDRFLQHFRTLLENIVANPGLPITQLKITSPGEREQVITGWNESTRKEGRVSCIHQLFEDQVLKTPDAIAVEFQQQRLNYRELNARANQLAHYLRKRGVAPDSRVGVYVHRSPEMMVALFAIMKAGGAYVPIDPMYPRERLDFMLQDAAVAILVTQEKLLEGLSSQEAQIVCIDRDWTEIAQESPETPAVEVTPANLSYVIFTSGSSGRPKGVQLEHRNVVNFINSVQCLFALNEKDIFLGVASMSFDASVLDFYLPLSVGARLVMVDVDTTRDGYALADTMARSGVTAMHATPSTWRSLIDAGWKGGPALKLLSGGEALPWDLAFRLLPCCSALWNLYGPTETAVYSAVHKVKNSDSATLVGRPVDNTQIYILDSRQEPAPIGIKGEIYIAGAGVARGYLNRPELTSEKFIPNPFNALPEARMYRTGDLGRYLADGVIECFGRADDQIKLRGFRIELGEIEAVLKQHPSVRQAVVDVRSSSSGDRRLVAYLVMEGDKRPDLSAVRGFLKTKLPDYMIPSAFMFLESIPVSPSGKLNRRALPDMDEAPAELPSGPAEPLTPVHQGIATIFSEVLEVRQVGLHDNFFELGGHSLLATRVISRLRDRFQIEMTPRVLFEAPTVEELAARTSDVIVQSTSPDEIETMLRELAELEEQ